MERTITKRSIAFFCAFAMLFSMLPLIGGIQKAQADDILPYLKSCEQEYNSQNLAGGGYPTKIVLKLYFDSSKAPVDGARIYNAYNGEQIGADIPVNDGSQPVYVTIANLKPNTTYYFNACTFKNSTNQEGDDIDVIAKTGSVTLPSLAVTKITSNNARIVLNTPNNQRYSGASTYYVYKGSKKIKTIKSSSALQVRFSYKRKGAGKGTYKVRAACAGKTYTNAKVFKPVKNQVKYSSQSKNPRNYTYATAPFVVTKIYYSGGKLKVQGYLLNARILDLKKAKIKVKVKVEGKTIASQKFTAKKKIGEYGKKKLTLTFKKAKKYKDLAHGATRWSTNTTATWY